MAHPALSLSEYKARVVKNVMMRTTTSVSVINVTHIICEQCFYTSLSIINVNNLNSALTLIHA